MLLMVEEVCDRQKDEATASSFLFCGEIDGLRERGADECAGEYA